MVADVVIQADGLGKRYVLGHQGAGGGYVALRDVIAHGAADFSRAVVHRMRGGRRQTEARKEEFWALHDVGFEVHRGEVIGIIGRNGAGKSTLLKVLSRITEPSAGRVRIRGRVASLLEVGTGFHAELTGRENIFLNGAILGMSGNEIRRKFDEIVAFADVEKFLDTPVKRYSSGMYVRLAFAVAAHLEPEILVVDEVLAVGDLEFQNKCLGKMSEVAGLGRTVLFVSHNMAAIRTLCSRGLLFTSGTITRDDAVASVIAEYLDENVLRAQQAKSYLVQPGLRLIGVHLSATHLRQGDGIEVEFEFEASESGVIHECAVLFCTLTGGRLAVIDAREFGPAPFTFGRGRFRVTAEVASLPLVEGAYGVGLFLRADNGSIDITDLRDIVVKPERQYDFIPIRPEWQGFLRLQAAVSVSEVGASGHTGGAGLAAQPAFMRGKA